MVVGGSEEEMLANGFKRADAEFPVFLHPDTGEEYALARTETKSGSGHKGFEVDVDSNITLVQDLVRRDFTINAMARDEDGNLIDMYGGRNDLAHRRLRHISPAFIEDPLRVLRAARFAARLEFSVAAETMDLMKQMVSSGELATIKSERLLLELLDAITGKAPWLFFEVLHECGALQALNLPLSDITHPITCLMRAEIVTKNPVVLVASVFYHSVAAMGGVESLDEVLRLPGNYTRLLDALLTHASHIEAAAEGDADAILTLITDLRAEQQPDRFEEFLQAASAIWPEPTKRSMPNITRALAAIGSISGAELQQQGLSGKALGAELKRLRLQAVHNSLSC
jgi:tRNA nucleotidyltransferase (CCA-adding enzyme)